MAAERTVGAVRNLEQRWPEAERAQHYARVLEPPKVRMRSDIPARSSERESKWLEEHGREYPGCRLAIHEDRLIAADPVSAVFAADEGEPAEVEATWFLSPDWPGPIV